MTEPKWNPDVQLFVDAYLNQSAGGAGVLEIGAGASTIWLAERAAEVISYEHDAGWYRRVLDELRANNLNNATVYHHPRPYVGQIAAETDDWFELVVVDGRDRVDCFAAAIKKVAPGGLIMLDDAQRPRYRQAVESVPKDWDRGQSEAHYPANGPHPAVCRMTRWWRRPL